MRTFLASAALCRLNGHVEGNFLPLLRSAPANLRLTVHHPSAGVLLRIGGRNGDRTVTSTLRRAGSGGESVVHVRRRNRDHAGDDEPRVHMVGSERGALGHPDSANQRPRRWHGTVHRQRQRPSVVPGNRHQSRGSAPANLAARQAMRISPVLDARNRGGSRRRRSVQVTTTSAQCAWTATSDVPWITIVSGRQGDDSGPVTFRVDPLSGPQRTGTLTIAGQAVQVQQGAGCSYSVSTDALNVGAAGGASEIAVSAPAGCTWTAQSGVPWITLARGATGSGPGVVALQVAATDGPTRTGTVTVAGRVVTVTQSPGCSFTIDPLTYAAPAAASTSATTVRAAAGCAWTAATASDWIVITAGQSGNGTGDVRFSVAQNIGPSRVGGIRIAGQTMTVNQASGCAITVTPTSVSVGAAASASTIQVTTAQGCTWSATSGVPWIALGDVSSGNGNGQVPFSVDANSGPARQGTLSIGGRTVTVAQASGCTYTVTPPSLDVAPAGGSGTASISDRIRLSLERIERRRLDHSWRRLRHRSGAGAVDRCSEQWTSPDWNSHDRLDCSHGQPGITL